MHRPPSSMKVLGKTYSTLAAVTVAAALADIALILIATSKFGVGLSPDSVGYVSAARHLASGQGFLLADSAPYVAFPPLYPILLAAGNLLTGLDPVEVARYAGRLFAGACVVLSGIWVTMRGGSRDPLAILFIFGVLLSVPLFGVCVMAWTEPLFALLALGSLLAVESEIVRANRASFAVLTVCVAAACLTRYIGIVLVPVGAASILLFEQRPFHRRLVRAVLFAALALVPLGIWCVRNLHLTGTLFGPRIPSILTLGANTSLALYAMISWLLPDRALRSGPLMVVLGMAFAFIAYGNQRALWRRAVASRAELWPLAAFVLSYTGFLVVACTATIVDPIGRRLMSPVYIPLVLIALRFAAEVRDQGVGRIPRRLLAWVGFSLVGIWFLYAGTLLVRDAASRGEQGAGGFSTRRWRESAVLAYSKDHLKQAPGTIYSNVPEAVYIVSGVPAKLSPRKTWQYSLAAVPLSSYRNSWPETRRARLVWFDRYGFQDTYSAAELDSIARLSLVMKSSD